MRAMSTLMRDAGMSTRVCLALTALRIRVSMSAIGSVMVLKPSGSGFLVHRSGFGAGFGVLGSEPNPESRTSNRTPNREPRTLNLYQLDFVTPVMSPSSASLRKHRRQSPNFRMYARGRPHRWQRLRSRTLNFAVLASFAILAVVAM